MTDAEREILQALDAAVRAARPFIDPIVARVDRLLQSQPNEVLAWEPIPLETYPVRLPSSIRSSWVFVLRAGMTTGAERHSNSQQRMMAYRGLADFQTKPGGDWISHHMTSDPAASLDDRWISIPPNVWHQGVIGPADWAVVSFHTILDHELIEERPAEETPGGVRQRAYVDSKR
jgi:hypothetical protein